jgi:hypothetical protein
VFRLILPRLDCDFIGCLKFDCPDIIQLLEFDVVQVATVVPDAILEHVDTITASIVQEEVASERHYYIIALGTQVFLEHFDSGLLACQTNLPLLLIE